MLLDEGKYGLIVVSHQFLHLLATSALDNESEKIVQDALDHAAEGILQIFEY